MLRPVTIVPLLAARVALALALAPEAAASTLLLRNLTGELMSVCYVVAGQPATCFGSADVPPYGAVTVNKGTGCVERWKVTRARDGTVKTLARRTGSGCGDRELVIRPDGGSFTLDAP